MSSADNIVMTSFDDLFGIGDDNTNKNNETNVSSNAANDINLDIQTLVSFKDHPFHVDTDNEDFSDLVESIKLQGILTPLLVRSKDDKYEVISGHRRLAAAKELGLDTVPCLIKDMDDNTAILMMVDSNIQRTNLLPSEKAFAYKMKQDALSNVPKGLTLLAEKSEDSLTVIKKYIRLTKLIPALLEMVDDDIFGVSIAYDLSFLREDEQIMLFSKLTMNGYILDIKKSKALKDTSNAKLLDESHMDAILEGKKAKKVNNNVTLKSKRLYSYFPKDTPKEEMEKVIFDLLEKWKNDTDKEKDND